MNMKYYTEEDTRDLRLELEKRVFEWPKVTTKKMFGCPCYQVNKKLFVFLVTKGIVITHLKEADKEELTRKYDTTFFKAGNKIVKKWIKLLIDAKELDDVMVYIRKSYESALQNK